MLAANSNLALSPSHVPDLVLGWKEIIDPIQPFLDQVAANLVDQIRGFEPEIASYASYALTNQGKQLRPVLVALSGGALGKLNDSLVTVATIIEMIHLATLVHDDVMDSAELRRRKPTLAANWGNQTSVLVGDCLFAQAVKLAASFPKPDICRAVAAATNRVCSGEIIQTLQRQNFSMNRAEYFRILEMKTAELFALSCELGASLAGGTPGECNALRSYGTALGTAYQIYDDCLDLFGTEILVGKSLGTDLVSGKLTLPLLVVLERADSADKTLLQDLITHWNPRMFSQVFELLERYGARDESCDVVHRFLEASREALCPLPHNRSREALATLTEFLAQQTDSLGVAT